ncbi:MAG: N-6 DNA methylase, partial [Thermoleophilia bacterium]|nr:N-6 DNA methylase [Thermoleophilia bacterium]
KADYILANPPFNMKDWGGERLRGDLRWKYGVPPVRNANLAWVQCMIHRPSPVGERHRDSAGCGILRGRYTMEMQESFRRCPRSSTI